MSACLLAYSCTSRTELERLANGFSALIRTDPDLAGMTRRVANLATSGGYRLACVATNGAELAASLDRFVGGAKHPHLAVGQTASRVGRRSLWAFSGYAPQGLDVGAELFRDELAFRDAMLACDVASAELGGPALVDHLRGKGDPAAAADAEVFQPFVFALQVSLAALWRRWGVSPDGVVGHSMGEVAAAHVAGALDLPDAMRIILARSAELRALRGQGGMASVLLSSAETKLKLDTAGASDVVVAACNGRAATVVSGPSRPLTELCEALRADGIVCKPLADTPGHSPLAEKGSQALETALAGLRPRRSEVQFYSTVDGARRDGATLDAAYWGANLRRPVLFADAVEVALRDGFDHVLEIGAQPVLLPHIEADAGYRDANRPLGLIPSLRKGRPERHTMLLAAARMYADGGNLNLAGIAAP